MKSLFREQLLGILLLSLCFVLFSSTSVTLAKPNEGIVYVGKEATIKATLTPDPSIGIVPTTSKEYTSFKIDSNTHSFELSAAESGNAKLTGNFNGIGEGRHEAITATLTPAKTIKDKKQLLFIYDVTPPEITIDPSTPYGTILPGQSISLRYVEKGSGIDTIDKNAIISATINGKSVPYTIIEESGDTGKILIVLTSSYSAEQFNVSLILRDRAGNEGQFERSFNIETQKYAHQYSCATKHYVEWHFPSKAYTNLQIETIPLSVKPGQRYQIKFTTSAWHWGGILCLHPGGSIKSIGMILS